MVESKSLKYYGLVRTCSKSTQDYTIEDRAGDGNASVDVVIHKNFKHWGECAMKSQKTTPQAIREALLQKRLDHKHIVITYDVFIAPDRQQRESLYIVMELASGK